MITVGKLSINLDRRSAVADGRPVELSRKEFSLLELLALRRGRVVSKETILDHLYNGMDEPSAKVIDVFVCKLRGKIAQTTGGPHYVASVYGQGYRLDERAPLAMGLAPSGRARSAVP